MALQHEHVGTANRFGITYVHLAVCEVVCRGFQHLGAQAVCDFLGQFGVCAARDQRHTFIRSALKNR